MTGAMYAAVAGLKAHMSALNVIGQNISNVNTNAYKSTRYTFLEALYTSVRGGSNGSALLGGKNPAQMGYGSSIGTIDLDMSTKNFTPTGRPTDVMIDGDGFLIVGDKGQTFTSQDDLKNMYLTRLGNLEFDSQGYLVDGQGQVVYGFLSVSNPVYNKYMDPQYDDTGAAQNADWLDPDAKESYFENVDEADREDGGFYLDKDGNLIQAKNEGTDDKPVWKTKIIDEYTPSPTLTAIRKPMFAQRTTKTVTTQDANGNDVTTEIEVTKAGDAVYPTYDTTTGEVKDVEDPDLTTGKRIIADSISIDENTGRITCTTSSGEAVVIGSIALAKVENPNGVTHVDGHYYQALEGAGDVRLVSIGHSVKNSNDPDSPFYEEPGPDQTASLKDFEIPINSGASTKLVGGGLESSGTDLASEISNMIMIQRGYQANTRIVTVTDSMLEELVNMKR